MKDLRFQPFSRIMAIRYSVTISLILNAILFIGHQNSGLINLSQLSFASISNFILFYSLYSFNFNVIKRNLSRHKKLLIATIGSIIIAIILNIVFDRLAILFNLELIIPHKFILIANLMRDLIIVIIVLLSTFLLNSIYEHQQTLIENEKLITENIRIRYEALKNQVDPHFLFNSLNTLDGLIALENEKGHEYVQNLASVFRYAIGNKEIMQLEDELNFTESYASLMKIRYGENLKIKYSIDKKYRTYYIMPISLQLLVENAIKHNVISNKQALTINIESTSNDTIKVWNVIQPKKMAESSEGIGLANLTERYNLLFQKSILITKTDVFCVEIPLIEELKTEKNNSETTQNSKRYISCNRKLNYL